MWKMFLEDVLYVHVFLVFYALYASNTFLVPRKIINKIDYFKTKTKTKMDFEHNAVESDYDEHYDDRQIVIENGRATYVSMTEDSSTGVRHAREIPLFEPQDQALSKPRRGPVQLPRCKPAEEVAEEAKTEPALVLPKGGWKVQHIKQPSFSILSEVKAELSRKESVAVPRPQETSPRPAWTRISKWKNITNEILSGEPIVEDQPTPAPVEVAKPSSIHRRAEVQSRHQSQTPTPNRVDEEEKRQNTKICRFVEITFKKTSAGIKTIENNKCRRPNCTYAHTMENWKPRPCRFQSSCRSVDTCPFKHEGETRESYYERTKNMS
jgi:hypothetical protein